MNVLKVHYEETELLQKSGADPDRTLQHAVLGTGQIFKFYCRLTNFTEH